MTDKIEVSDAEVEAALNTYYPKTNQSIPSWKEWSERGGHDYFTEMREALEAAAAVRASAATDDERRWICGACQGAAMTYEETKNHNCTNRAAQ